MNAISRQDFFENLSPYGQLRNQKMLDEFRAGPFRNTGFAVSFCVEYLGPLTLVFTVI